VSRPTVLIAFVVDLAACMNLPVGPQPTPLACTSVEPAGILYAVECSAADENSLCFSPDNTGI
jgi:hypothetical protein